MNTYKTHKDLDVWKLGIELVKDVYIMTKNFPRNEQYGLVSQMRKSAVSIPSNIAEGAARSSKKEYVQFLYIALGSLSELETQLIIAKELEYTCDLTSLKKISTLRRKLLNLIKFLKTNR
jgi:four helix bundle protein